MPFEDIQNLFTNLNVHPTFIFAKTFRPRDSLVGRYDKQIIIKLESQTLRTIQWTLTSTQPSELKNNISSP